ncbi:MAG: hypothetical protein IJ169_08105 [Paludibacteraceae bacterium]|nr:hypothetical protein [Paludibacteraceae bacterium]
MKRHYVYMLLTFCLLSAACATGLACESISYSWLTTGQTSEEAFEDLNTANVTESLYSKTWRYDPSYGAVCNGYGTTSEQWLLLPIVDLRGVLSATLEFKHVINFANDMEKEQTLWVCNDYAGSVVAANWQQVIISDYPQGDNWKDWRTVRIELPEELLQNNILFAFCYKSDAEAEKQAAWEIKDVKLNSTCDIHATPVSLPELGEGRLKVCAQNLENYYWNYDKTDRTRTSHYGYTDDEGRAEKTRKIVNAMLMADADVYAFCEVEADPFVLQQLADSMNKYAEADYYTYAADGISYVEDSYDNHLKSGFIYRNDKVKTHGGSFPASSAFYYRETMRLQSFEELTTGSRFTLSMNHFKSGSGDSNITARATNASQLLSSLTSQPHQKAILVMGDMNAQIDESSLQQLVEAGYEEQLLRYDEYAYSYCYYGTEELIDHSFANKEMRKYVTGAGVFHICTACGSPGSKNEDYRYSDHDPYLVAFSLPSATGIDGTEAASNRTGAGKVMENGVIYIIRNGQRYTVLGIAVGK